MRAGWCPAETSKKVAENRRVYGPDTTKEITMMVQLTHKHPTKATAAKKAPAAKAKNPKKGWVKGPDGTYRHESSLKGDLEASLKEASTAGKKITVVKIDAQRKPKKEKQATQPEGAKSVASTARDLILAGKTNDEVLTELVKLFPGFDLAKKKSYPAWYRADLKRKGLVK